jgi:hypothetical protein
LRREEPALYHLVRALALWPPGEVKPSPSQLKASQEELRRCFQADPDNLAWIYLALPRYLDADSDPNLALELVHRANRRTSVQYPLPPGFAVARYYPRGAQVPAGRWLRDYLVTLCERIPLPSHTDPRISHRQVQVHPRSTPKTDKPTSILGVLCQEKQYAQALQLCDGLLRLSARLVGEARLESRLQSWGLITLLSRKLFNLKADLLYLSGRHQELSALPGEQERWWEKVAPERFNQPLFAWGYIQVLHGLDVFQLSWEGSLWLTMRRIDLWFGVPLLAFWFGVMALLRLRRAVRVPGRSGGLATSVWGIAGILALKVAWDSFWGVNLVAMGVDRFGLPYPFPLILFVVGEWWLLRWVYREARRWEALRIPLGGWRISPVGWTIACAFLLPLPIFLLSRRAARAAQAAPQAPRRRARGEGVIITALSFAMGCLPGMWVAFLLWQEGGQLEQLLFMRTVEALRSAGTFLGEIGLLIGLCYAAASGVILFRLRENQGRKGVKGIGRQA